MYSTTQPCWEEKGGLGSLAYHNNESNSNIKVPCIDDVFKLHIHCNNSKIQVYIRTCMSKCYIDAISDNVYHKVCQLLILELSFFSSTSNLLIFFISLFVLIYYVYFLLSLINKLKDIF